MIKLRGYKQGAIAATFLVSMTGSAWAVEAPERTQAPTGTTQTATTRQGGPANATQQREAAQVKAQERRAAAETRLSEAKLKACQKREEAIGRIMTGLVKNGEKQIEVMTILADRTKAFYETEGKTVAGYGKLVADVAAKKAAAEAAVASSATAGESFSCEGENPKGVAATFKTQVKAQIEALQAYKTAVKNLIVGVKSVHPEAQAGSETETAKPEAQKPAAEGGR